MRKFSPKKLETQICHSKKSFKIHNDFTHFHLNLSQKAISNYEILKYCPERQDKTRKIENFNLTSLLKSMKLFLTREFTKKLTKINQIFFGTETCGR